MEPPNRPSPPPGFRLSARPGRRGWLAASAALALGAACSTGITPASPPSGMPPLPAPVDPGRVTIHRLNRVEYNNTVRDLLGTARRPADDFPSDDRGYGFDNVADVLSLSPLQVELYDHAAEALATEAITVPIAAPTVLHFEAQQVKSMVGGPYGKDAWMLWSNGEITAIATVPADGRYAITVKAAGQQAGNEPARMGLNIDGVEVQQFDVPAVEAQPGTYAAEVRLWKGGHPIGFSFLNDYYNPQKGEDRNLIVYFWEVKGPLDLPPATNPVRQRVMTCDPALRPPADCAREIVGNFARRAFRRPITDDELSPLLALAASAPAAGDSFDAGIALALEAVLTSPHFLFRVETDPAPDDPSAHPVSDYELASRLSYFLWSSMPDDALLAAAAAGTLNTPEAIAAQVSRMLADPRAEALVANFAGQWLYTRAIDDHLPDPAAFPSWDSDLKAGLRAETEALFRELLFEGQGVDALLTADWTWVTARLARHYGLPFDASGPALQRASLAESPRRGVLGHGSVQFSTSYPLRTSPVKRGKWVLEQLLCSGPPDPPPNVPGLTMPDRPTGSLRQRLEQHRADPNCAVCHTQMDSIGFALENFDGIGAYRTTDSGFPIDASGDLKGLGHFDGQASLSALLATDKRFHACVTQQLFTYALGRAPAASDGDSLGAITAAFEHGGGKLADLVTRIAQSDAFRRRHGEPASPGGKI